jgi:uncharacterized membrane protein
MTTTNTATNINVHPTERRISTLLGGILLLHSLNRRSFALGEKVLAAALLYRGIRGHSFLYQALGVSTIGGTGQQQIGTSDNTPEVERSITIEKPADKLYHFWRDPRHLSQILGENAEIRVGSGGLTHWIVQGPFNRRIEWDTQIVEDRPNEIIRWQSLEGAPLLNEGSVRFRRAPGDWGTEVTLHIRFDLPGGQAVNKTIKYLGFVPRMLVEKALRRFKSLAETGEFPTLAHNPSARLKSYAHS